MFTSTTIKISADHEQDKLRRLLYEFGRTVSAYFVELGNLNPSVNCMDSRLNYFARAIQASLVAMRCPDSNSDRKPRLDSELSWIVFSLEAVWPLTQSHVHRGGRFDHLLLVLLRQLYARSFSYACIKGSGTPIFDKVEFERMVSNVLNGHLILI